MCNYELLAVDQGVSHEQVHAQLKAGIDVLGDLSQYNYVFLTSQGSFFDRHEISDNLRLEIGRELKRQNVRQMSTESEAKYCVKEEYIRAFKEALGADLTIGIGLEAYDDFARNVIINKGLPKKTFERAAENLANVGAGFYTYVTLGKPFMSIKEDVEDAISAIEYSFASGAFMCVVEMVNIQPFTLTEHLWRREAYKPPSLWTGIHLLLELAPELRKRVSLKGHEPDIEPKPVAFADSCPVCRTRLSETIRNWNYYRNVDVLYHEWGSCICFAEWDESRSSANHSDIGRRVDEGLRLIENDLF